MKRVTFCARDVCNFDQRARTYTRAQSGDEELKWRVSSADGSRVGWGSWGGRAGWGWGGWGKADEQR